MKLRIGCLFLVLSALCAGGVGAQGSDPEPSFGNLIKNSPYLRNLGNEAAANPPAASAVAVSSQPQVQPNEAAIAQARAAEKAGRFQDAIATIQHELSLTPRRAKLRYYLAYLYYAQGKAEPDAAKQKQTMELARQAVYRTLDLQDEKGDPENSVWVANAEVLFDRISAAGDRPIPPLHGRVVKPFDGTGGVLVGGVLGPDGNPLYSIAGKPVSSFGHGLVEEAGRDRNLGLVIRVRYQDARGQPFAVTYGNLQDTNGLTTGMSVEANTILGHVAKGAARDEPTLYLEIQRQGKRFDPAKLLTGSAQQGTTF